MGINTIVVFIRMLALMVKKRHSANSKIQHMLFLRENKTQKGIENHCAEILRHTGTGTYTKNRTKCSVQLNFELTWSQKIFLLRNFFKVKISLALF